MVTFPGPGAKLKARAKRIRALSLRYACPVCGAKVNETCITPQGNPKSYYHMRRVRLIPEAEMKSIKEEFSEKELPPSTPKLDPTAKPLTFPAGTKIS